MAKKKIKLKKGSKINELSINSPEYRQLYESGTLASIDEEGVPNMYYPEVNVVGDAPLKLRKKRQLAKADYTDEELERYMYQGKIPDRDKDFLLPPGERLKIYNAVLPFEYPDKELPKALRRYITGEERKFLGQESIKEEDRDLGRTDEDAWAHFMGLPQLYNTVDKSEYLPTDSKSKNAEYYTIRKGYPDFDELLLENAHNWFQRKENTNANTLRGVGSPFMPLENVTYSKGQDERGKYYSMYDVYDFNVPYQKGIGKPYEVYDRVYYDDTNPDKPVVLKKSYGGKITNMKKKKSNNLPKMFGGTSSLGNQNPILGNMWGTKTLESATGPLAGVMKMLNGPLAPLAGMAMSSVTDMVHAINTPERERRPTLQNAASYTFDNGGLVGNYMDAFDAMAYGGMIDPSMAMQQLMYGSYAQGGQVPQNIPVEVEGEEMYEMPNGQVGEFSGPKHENGGMPMSLPEGTKIYSDRLKVNGKTMAARKDKREANIAKLEKLLTKNPNDKFIKEALKRQQETNALQEQGDMQQQEMANEQQAQEEMAMEEMLMGAAQQDMQEGMMMAMGGMIKRADGSYSKRGLWDNIRANKGSGKKPTKEMLKQEKKIKAAEKAYGGMVEYANGTPPYGLLNYVSPTLATNVRKMQDAAYNPFTEEEWKYLTESKPYELPLNVKFENTTGEKNRYPKTYSLNNSKEYRFKPEANNNLDNMYDYFDYFGISDRGGVNVTPYNETHRKYPFVIGYKPLDIENPPKTLGELFDSAVKNYGKNNYTIPTTSNPNPNALKTETIKPNVTDTNPPFLTEDQLNQFTNFQVSPLDLREKKGGVNVTKQPAPGVNPYDAMNNILGQTFGNIALSKDPYINTKGGMIPNPLYNEVIGNKMLQEEDPKKPNRFMNFLNNAVDETGDFFTGLFDRNGKPKKERGTNTNLNVNPNIKTNYDLTEGDRTGMFGTSVGMYGPALMTMLNRMETPPNTNYFSTFGQDALRTQEEAEGLAGISKDEAYRKNLMRANALRKQLANTARGVNDIRSGQLTAELAEQEGARGILTNYLQGMSQLKGQRAGLQQQIDQTRMGGEQQRDLADRQDIDQYYTNLAENVANASNMIQKQGRDLNVVQYNKDIMNLSKAYSKYGIYAVRDPKSGLLTLAHKGADGKITYLSEEEAEELAKQQSEKQPEVTTTKVEEPKKDK